MSHLRNLAARPIRRIAAKIGVMNRENDFWDSPFDDSDYFTGLTLSDAMIRDAEVKIGYKLPRAFIRLIKIKNGGSLKRDCFPTPVATSWAKDHVAVSGIRGIGGQWSIGKTTFWKYPDVGFVAGECPSAGHDVIMLDYSECGRNGEPRVIHVETETAGAPEVLILASDFESFLEGLREYGNF